MPFLINFPSFYKFIYFCRLLILKHLNIHIHIFNSYLLQKGIIKVIWLGFVVFVFNFLASSPSLWNLSSQLGIEPASGVQSLNHWIPGKCPAPTSSYEDDLIDHFLPWLPLQRLYFQIRSHSEYERLGLQHILWGDAIQTITLLKYVFGHNLILLK